MPTKLGFVRAAANNPIIPVFLLDSTSTTGAGKTGLAFNTAGLRVTVRRELSATVTEYKVDTDGNIETITTLGTYAAPTASKCRFKEVDASLQPGMYEIQFAQAIVGTGDASRFVSGCVYGTGVAPCPFSIPLTGFDLQTASVAQSGDSYNIVKSGGAGDAAAILLDTAEIGAAGAGLTNLGDARMANLDATVSSRLAPAGTLALCTATTTVTNLTNAPPDSAGVTTLLGRLGAFTGTGWNTVLGFFRALLRKDVGVTLPSDIGGTFDNTTDAVEAIRDTAPLGTAMRGTDNAALAATALDNTVWTNAKAAFLDELVSAAKTLTAAERNAIADAAKARAISAESYAADGATPTLSQILWMIWSGLADYSISGTTFMVKNQAGGVAMTFTLDDATAPTSRTRAT